jgi:hypothetical protein
LKKLLAFLFVLFIYRKFAKQFIKAMVMTSTARRLQTSDDAFLTKKMAEIEISPRIAKLI